MLVPTKLQVPRPPAGIVARPRLTDALEAGARGRLAVVVAPAGSGKTTLLTEWASVTSLRVAWLALDAGDNDPARFWQYVVAALGGMGEGTLALLRAHETEAASLVAPILADAESVSTPFALVLDDYHLVENDAIHAGLAFLVDRAPSSMHVVVASRTDPPLPLARLRARGHLTELRVADLRFDEAEASAFLGAAVAPEHARSLAASTEGWGAGLRLAALSLERASDGEAAEAAVRAFTGGHRHLVDYFAGEVLDRLPEELVAFLVETSILDRLCAPLAAAVTGREGAQASLERLERMGLFTIPLDEERRWYRYHHLFSEFLRGRLAVRDDAPELHRRASRWFAEHGHALEAVPHAIAAGEHVCAASLVEETGRALVLAGETDTVVGWVRALPEEVVRARPRLRILFAWALQLANRADEAEAYLVDLESALGDVAPDERIALLGHAAVIGAEAARMRYDLPRALELSARALALVPEEDTAWRALGSLNRGCVLEMVGEYAEAGDAFAAAARHGRAEGDLETYLLGVWGLAKVRMSEGRMHAAHAACEEAVREVERSDAPAPVYFTLAHVALGEIHCEWNDLDTSERHLERAVALAERYRSESYLTRAYLGMAKLERARGDAAKAIAWLDRALEIWPPAEVPTILPRIGALRARFQIATGEVDEARRWMRAHDFAVGDEPGAERWLEYGTVARIALAEGDAASSLAALGLVERLERVAARTGFLSRAVEASTLHALALEALGDATGAASAILRALALAEPEGFIRSFADAGPGMGDVLARAAKALKRGRASRGAPSDAYLARVLAAAAPDAAPEALTAPLSRAELEVIRLVAIGASNQEIADRLFVALSTVKKHVNHIYAKLDAPNRTTAVARARTLGLLGGE